jgi:hypothetical protein
MSFGGSSFGGMGQSGMDQGFDAVHMAVGGVDAWSGRPGLS